MPGIGLWVQAGNLWRRHSDRSSTKRTGRTIDGLCRGVRQLGRLRLYGGRASTRVLSFRQRLTAVEVALHNQDNREHDIFDSDDYLQFHGGMIATIRVYGPHAGVTTSAIRRIPAGPGFAI